MVGTFVGSVISGILVSKNNIEKNYLSENEFYAKKLAASTDSLFKDMIDQLTMASKNQEFLSTDPNAIYKKLDQLLQGPDFFNSTWFVDASGKVIASAPKLDLEGSIPNSLGVKEALLERKPLISVPYTGITGQLILLISVPIFKEDGTYAGFLAGTIHLYENNSLKEVLGEHPKSETNSYVYVVDSIGNIIYHPNAKRINDNVMENMAVKHVLNGESGSREIVNSKGVSMLAGYAPAKETTKWGIVSQTPKKAEWGPIMEYAKQVCLTIIPFMVFGFILTYVLAQKIVNPIRSLASYARKITKKESVQIPKIPDWYNELIELKRALLMAFESYQKKLEDVEYESNLDPLTGFYNRRSLDKSLHELEMYSIILLDIDHFKKVNDEYGHQKGDEVLKFLAGIIKTETRESDLCFRIGGEEFLLILPSTDISTAESIAERLRKIIAETISPIGKATTVSMGVGNVPETEINYKELMKWTDQALYKAKQMGRNRVVVAKKMDDFPKGNGY